MKRRNFIKKSIAAGAFICSGLMYSCSKKSGRLKILVLGGTNFVGPSIVNEALQLGHEVTLFNRGITNPDLFPNLKLIKGDRENGSKAYSPLLEVEWDVIIDVWPEKSALVEEAVIALKDHTNHYIFISSIAVFNNFQEVGLNEESEVVSLDLNKDDWGYSEEKLAAENIVKTHFPDNHTILRPGAIKGWRDPGLDLLYWCTKLNRDESVIAPGSGMDPIQFIDVKDVGRFTIMAIENNITGIYNCLGPQKKPLLWKDFLEAAKNHFKSKTELVWANEAFLSENKVASFSDLPLWAPLSEDRGFMQISNKKMCQTGFEFTSFNSTLDDCLKWYKTSMKKEIKFGSNEVEIGLDRNREMELIQKLRG